MIPGNGAVPSSDGSTWIRSDLTSWGTHAMFTVAAGGGSTSESTPPTGGVLGLLLSYGNLAYSQHLIPSPLTGAETVQVMAETAKPFTDPTLGWPGTPITPGAPDNWSEQDGYGMPDLNAAMARVAAGPVPAAASIDSPDWYSTFDPTTISQVPVTGTINAATATTGFSWTLEAAPGGQPANSAFTDIGTGSGTGSGVGNFSGTLGTLDLSTIPPSVADAPAALSTDKAASTNDQYAVTFRLVVTKQVGLSARTAGRSTSSTTRPCCPATPRPSTRAAPEPARQGRPVPIPEPALKGRHSWQTFSAPVGWTRSSATAPEPCTPSIPEPEMSFRTGQSMSKRSRASPPTPESTLVTSPSSVRWRSATSTMTASCP